MSMQKARRLTCSSVCQSSPSNTSVRTRKKSRASSESCDSAKVKNSIGGASGDKRKFRSNKCNASFLSTVTKPKRTQPAKHSRAGKPNVGCLQSTVVLAPFYTLKKCFQNKLVDMYSNEKTKKLNQMMRRAKKKNMSFEYDIIELKPRDEKVKEEWKSFRSRRNRSRRRSRSTSYCQCNRGNKEPKAPESRSKPKRKASSRQHISPTASTNPEQSQAKRRKINFEFPVPAGVKFETAHGHDFCAPSGQFGLNEGNQGFEVLSSRSKCEFWDTYSNSPSFKEEHMQGSLAISTTSFDSYLEHFDESNWNYSGSNSRKCNSQKQQQQPPKKPDLLPKPNAENLIVNVDRKNSDGEIVDFMDREPQTEVIPSFGSFQQWRPLRRQNKTKRKKPENNSAATGYYLRSCSKEKNILETTHRQECKSSTANMNYRIETPKVEVGTQVEETYQRPTSNVDPSESPQDTCQQLFCMQTQEEPSCCSKEPMQSPPASDLEPPQSPLEQQQQSECFEEQRADLSEEHLDMSSVELMGGFSDRFEGPTDSRQPQDKEYIFGSRKSTSGLGESCDFSFGLKWTLSDDED